MKTAEEILRNYVMFENPLSVGATVTMIVPNIIQAMEEYANQSKWAYVPKFPDHSKGVLVLLKNGHMAIGIKLYDEDKFVQKGGEDFPKENQPIAWQPLPKI